MLRSSTWAVAAAPVVFTRFGSARVCSVWLSEPSAPVARVRLVAFRTPTTFASRLFTSVFRSVRFCAVASSVLSSPFSRLPSRSPLPVWASALTWIWSVLRTRPSRFRLIGATTRLRTFLAPAGGVWVTEGAGRDARDLRVQLGVQGVDRAGEGRHVDLAVRRQGVQQVRQVGHDVAEQAGRNPSGR